MMPWLSSPLACAPQSCQVERQNFKNKNSEGMMAKVIFITGATSGFGAAIINIGALDMMPMCQVPARPTVLHG